MNKILRADLDGSNMETLLTADNPVGIALDLEARKVYFTDSTVVPAPAAVWLFGSGLLGLIGIAKGKKS